MSSLEEVEKVVVSEICLSIARTVCVAWEAKKEFNSSVVSTSSTSYLAIMSDRGVCHSFITRDH